MPAIPKPNFKRRKPKQVNRNRFSPATMEEIRIAFNNCCAECGRYTDNKPPHHIMFKSQCGRGVKTNGLWVCPTCHEQIHKHKELTDKWRKWAYEKYGENYYKDKWD